MAPPPTRGLGTTLNLGEGESEIVFQNPNGYNS